MNFRTTIDISASKIKISHQSKILMMGSCFATNMGQKLIDNKFNINLNPFGVLYNPTSIAKGLELLMSGKRFTKEDVFLDKGLYNSFYHHSSFSNSNRERCLSKIDTCLTEAKQMLEDADVLFITFGTAYVYEYIPSGEIVGNCHKLPSKDFRRYRLSVSDIVKQWRNLLLELKAMNSNLQIIFTVSPIRHLRDGAHDNQLSKSTLLLAIEKLCEVDSDTHYFPSYEIVLDDLRDYRFYAEDLIHPNNLAIEYIWKILKDAYLAKESETIIAEWKNIKRAIDHRPFNEYSEEYIDFLKQTLLRLNQFGAKYEYILLTRERELLEERINRRH